MLLNQQHSRTLRQQDKRLSLSLDVCLSWLTQISSFTIKLTKRQESPLRCSVSQIRRDLCSLLSRWRIYGAPKVALTAAGNKTLARERNNYLKKTDLRFVCVFACAKTSHITSLTDRKLYGLTSVIYRCTSIDNRHTSCPWNVTNVNATWLFLCHFVHGLYKN